MSEASSSPGLFNANFQVCSQTLREQCIFLCQTVVKRDTTSVFSGSNNAKLFYEETSKLFQLGRTLRILCRAFQSTVRLSTLASERQPFSLAAGPDTQRETHHFHCICNCQVVCPGKKRRRVRHVGM